MIGTNITSLRKQYDLTQEEVAEQLSVSRQTLAKWERGESEPDMRSCIKLAEMFQVTLDELVNYEEEAGMQFGVPPKGKYFFGSVTVGERGQIVIPQKARRVFKIEPGDQVLVLGDEERGIAIIPKQEIWGLMNVVLGNDKKKEK
ncbi:MAG: helix-turn-helix domain-containing protein [Lachnospiraceae bacterium]|nr:helix-turn-helix domain-containing protein [Lachnospiraceae bacterium]